MFLYIKWKFTLEFLKIITIIMQKYLSIPCVGFVYYIKICIAEANLDLTILKQIVLYRDYIQYTY